MEKRWDTSKPMALHAMAAAILVAGTIYLFAALESAARIVGTGLGAAIGRAVGSVLRALFSVGGSLPQPPGPDTRLPSLIGRFRSAGLLLGRLRGAGLTDASAAVAASAVANRIAATRTATKKRPARSARPFRRRAQ